MSVANADLLSTLLSASGDPVANVEVSALGRWHREVWMGICVTASEDALRAEELQAAHLLALQADILDPRGRLPLSSGLLGTAASRHSVVLSGPMVRCSFTTTYMVWCGMLWTCIHFADASVPRRAGHLMPKSVSVRWLWPPGSCPQGVALLGTA